VYLEALFFFWSEVVMPETETMKAKPLTKQTALDYLERSGKPATAKELAIDLDSRASTASELLERMTAQGLVERDEKQRPREYVLTDAGRKRLEFFRSRQGESRPESAADRESNPGSEEERQHDEPEPVNVGELKEEVTRQFEGLREDMRSLVEFLNLRPATGEGRRERVERLKQRLESLTEQYKHLGVPLATKEHANGEAVRNLYRARYELRSLGFFDSRREVTARIEKLEAEVGKEVAQQVEQLVSLERKICGGWDSNAGMLRGVLELRDALHLPGSVFGLAKGQSGKRKKRVAARLW